MNTILKKDDLVYECIVSKETIRELESQGLSKEEIILFADDIMARYFNSEYLDIERIRE